MDMVMYVDDGYLITSCASTVADEVMAELHAAFTLELKPVRFFLGNNVDVFDAARVGAP